MASRNRSRIVAESYLIDVKSPILGSYPEADNVELNLKFAA